MTTSFGPVATLLTFLFISCIIAPCHAQTNKIFQWEFSGSALSQSLPSCRSFGITVKPFNPANNTHGVPPFYMTAFAVGGTPTTSLIGTDESNLSWTVDQPVGAQLLLQVVDSTGSAGGVPPRLFTVVAGQSTQCITPPDTTLAPFTVTANVTDTLNTCQPWGITVKGGTPPYNLTLAALNSPITTNVTMGPVDDQFTFIDRADPGVMLIAAISDLNGRWATGVPIVKTAGSSNVDCIGLVSSSGNSTVIKQQAAAALASAKASHQTALIAGVVTTVVVILLLGIAGIFLFLRRRRNMRATTPRQFEGGNVGGNPAFQETGTHVLSINAFIDAPSEPYTPPKSPAASQFTQPLSPSTHPYPATPRTFDRRTRTTSGAGEGSVSSASSGRSAPLSVRNPGRAAAFTSFPRQSVRRSAKEIEAGMVSPGDSDSEFPSELSRNASAGPSGSQGTEVIYQHQDAGVVRELPPPYADRGQT